MTIYDYSLHISGEEVVNLQLDINSYYGYQKLVVDGSFGDLTAAACPTMKRGDVYKIVGEIQSRLRKKGYYPEAIDNSFGPATERAVKAYQAYWDGVQTGVVDKWWWHKLYEILG